MYKTKKIYLAGHSGLVGSAILNQLKSNGYSNIITKTSSCLDLTKQADTELFFEQDKPEIVILAAARVGGINANMTYPAGFLYQNIMIASNVIHSAHKVGVEKLLFLGSSCIYPRDCLQPMREEYLLSGYCEPTNEGYAIAKIAGLKLCEFYNTQYGDNYISCMPTNIYGPEDNFNIETSHVIPALMRRMHEAKLNNVAAVTIWGSGQARREFMYVNDLASACLFLLENYSQKEFINVGVGADVSIKELANIIKDVVGYSGCLEFDTTKPDGNMKKLLDVSKITTLGWSASTELKEGLVKTYEWFRTTYGKEIR